jgi:hypothetical protein
LNAFAVGLGLNDDALIFNLLFKLGAFAAAPVFRLSLLPGCVGVADPVPDPGAVGMLPVELEVDGDGRVLLPLKGGIAWMYMLIPVFPPVFAGGDAARFAFPCFGVAAPATLGPGPALLGGGSFRVLASAPFTADTGIRGAARAVGGAPAAVTGDEPIVRARVDVASRVVFSLIRRCLSSSLARIGTRSSGIGLFS